VISPSPAKRLTEWQLDPRIIAMTTRDRVLLAFGPYELDMTAQELRRDGRSVRIAPQAFHLLVALTAAPSDVVSRETLRRTLWPDDTHVDFERSLNSAMRKLRVALNDSADSARYIQTLPGRGYRFIAPVRRPTSIGGDDDLAQRDGAQPSVSWLRRRDAIAAVVCAVAAVTVAIVLAQHFLPATRSEDARAAYRRGIALGDERITDLSRGIAWFERAVDLDPAFAPAWAAVARARATRAMLDGRDGGELRQARNEAQRALRMDGGLADAHIASGQVRLALENDAVGAEIDFRTARALGADAGRHQLWLVWALHTGGSNADALQVVDEVLAREPGNATFRAWRGMLLHTVHRYDDELIELQRAVSMDGDSWQAALHLGLGYARREAFDRALPALKRAVVLSDTGGIPLLWLGRMAADAGDLATAEQVVQQLRDIARARGVTPSFADSVESHIAVYRQKTKRALGA
jgi:DNA-binding winged helix-turn-helix (wHTH) protein